MVAIRRLIGKNQAPVVYCVSLNNFVTDEYILLKKDPTLYHT